MTLMERLHLWKHIIHWRFTWSKKNLDYKPAGPVSSKFVSAREAAGLIPDGSTVFSNGLAGNARCSVFFWAVRDAFQRTGHPSDLTWVNIGAQGGRGKVPGTVEEVALPGLLKRYLAGHLETCKTQLKMAEQQQLEMHTLPQGVMSLLVEGQANGETHQSSKVGVGTFLDPRVGPGSPLTPDAAVQYVRENGEELWYTLPKIEIALINAPYADAAGNIYFRDAASWTDNIESARAARANGGKVLVTVSQIVPKVEQAIDLPAQEVDHIVVHPYNEQTASVQQRRFWPMFTPGGEVDASRACAQLRFINNVLKITPVRGPVEYTVARLAAEVFVREVSPNAMINIGVGLPEEVARQLIDHGLSDQLIFTTEAGSYGGLPAPGIFFGAAIGPDHLESSARMFHRYETELDVAILGFLQVDGMGNVNASHRGPHLTDIVGPGGFPDIATGARTVIFIGSWMSQARFELNGHKMRIAKPGACKFVDQVDHITFSAREALGMGKKVFYVTHVGVFALTEKGLELRQVMPGIDIERDILQASTAEIQVAEDVEVVDPVAWKGEKLQWKLVISE